MLPVIADFCKKHFCIKLSGFSTLLFVLALSQIATQICQAYPITITDFKISHPAPNKIKVMMAAKGEGVEIGSYCIRLDSWPGEAGPPAGFVIQSSGGSQVYTYFAHDNDILLKDNSPIDEDTRPGVFALTFDTTKWSEGDYHLLFCAHNRPAPGNYISDSRFEVITIGTAKKPRKSLVNAPQAQNHVIYQKDGIYACFPGLYLRPDNKLAISFGTRLQRSHIDPTGGSQAMISSDGGYNWQITKEPIIDRRWLRKDSTLARALATGWIYVPEAKLQELEQQHKTILHARKDTIAYLGGADWHESLDNGKTWNRHSIDITDNISGLMNFLPAASELLTSSQIRLTAVYGSRINQSHSGGLSLSEVFLLRSEDDGQSWTCQPMYPNGLPDPNLGFNETALVETADGTIIAMMRPVPEGFLYQSNSKDGGKTWSPPVNTGIWGYPAHLLALDNNIIVCTYGYRKAPMGIRACISRDGGITWQKDKIIILRDDGCSSSDLGYPQTCHLGGGKLFTIYYMTTPQDNYNTHVASTHWQLPDR